MMKVKDEVAETSQSEAWDHSSHEQFYHYYADASRSDRAIQRFRAIRETALRTLATLRPVAGALDVADIGCGAGTQSMLWAELGHRVHGLDVNDPLLKLAVRRAAESGYAIDFRLGSATDLPWGDQSMDVCLLLELLEHVPDWEACLIEGARVLKPGGLLVLTTSSKLCPVQQEFNLPLYSWYPPPMKRYFERLSVTSHPHLANYAKYPAVHWFSFYRLRDYLRYRGLRAMDRFDVIDVAKKAVWAQVLIRAIRSSAILRWLGHVATPGTIIFATKNISEIHRSEP